MNWHSVIVKGLKKRRKQTLIMLSGIILGVILITTVLASYQGMRDAVQEDMFKYGEPYILTNENKSEQISYRGVPLLINKEEQTEKLSRDDYQTLQKDKEYLGISPRAIKPVINSFDNKELALVGIDFSEEKKMKPWWKVWGNWPKNDNEVLLGYDVAQKYNLYSGDSISLKLADIEKNYKIAGYLHYTGHTDDQLIYTFIEDSFFEDGIDFVEAVLPYKIEMEQQTKLKGWSWSKIESPMEERAKVISLISSITPYMFGVTIFLGGVLIFIGLISQIEERRKEFSLWRAIGFNRAWIIRFLLMEVFLLAIVGSLIGLVLGIISANILNALMSEFKFFAYIHFVQAIIIIATTISVSFITAIVPIRIALKQDPLNLLKSDF